LLKCLLLAVTVLTIAALIFFISLNLIVMRVLYPIHEAIPFECRTHFVK
jgi:hypothetical protein